MCADPERSAHANLPAGRHERHCRGLPQINKGRSPIPETRDPASEFQFVEISDEEKNVNFIVEAAVKLKSRDANFQVLSPKYDGEVGVTL